MLRDWLSWKKIRLFVLDHWSRLLGAGMGCLVLIFSVYFVQVQKSARQRRLNQLDVSEKQHVRTRPVNNVEDVDQPLQGMLPPRPEIHRPGDPDARPITSWGSEVQETALRAPEIPLQPPPSRAGPDG